MKSLVLIILCGIAASPSLAGVDDKPTTGEPRVFLTVVLDTSPTGNDRWQVQKSLLLEAIHSLKAGDQVELVTARPGDPAVQLAVTMVEPLQAQQETAARVVSRIPKEWLASADMDRAINTAHLGLLNRGEGYRSCLLVLSSGRIGEHGLAELRRVAAALKQRGWPVCVICDGEQANRPVLVAGSKGQFELRFTDNAALGQWIASVRTPTPPIAAVAKEGRSAKTETPPAPAKEPTRTADSASTATEATVTKPGASATQGNRGTVDVRIVDMPPFGGPQPQPVPPQGESTKRAEPAVPVPIAPPRQQKDATKAKSDMPATRKLPIGIIIGGIFGVGLAGLTIYVLKDVVAVGRLRRRHGLQDETVESAGRQLVAFIGDRREELGNLEDIQDLTIGKGLGSHIYIDGPGVEDRHARIFRRRKGLRVQNTAGAPIVINGLEVPPKAKVDLVLPSDIELAPGVTVSLLAETLEPQVEVHAHENDPV
jgi:hypothetical protein